MGVSCDLSQVPQCASQGAYPQPGDSGPVLLFLCMLLENSLSKYSSYGSCPSLNHLIYISQNTDLGAKGHLRSIDGHNIIGWGSDMGYPLSSSKLFVFLF